MYSMTQNPYLLHTVRVTSQPMMPQSISTGLLPPNGVLGENELPTHVVGRQGRRGILPSDPSRPVSPAPGTNSAKKRLKFDQDADGKFPCPHCERKYQHAKHLRRHLLRHTGERPYMCILCGDTFTRSDVLKRHFQKCSSRRGNPTGASQLSRPQAHVRKNAQSQKAAGMGEGDMNQMNGMPQDGMVHPFGMAPVHDQNNMDRMGNPANGDRRGMDRPVMGGSQPYGGTTHGQQMHGYSAPRGQSGMPMYDASSSTPQSNFDWLR